MALRIQLGTGVVVPISARRRLTSDVRRRSFAEAAMVTTDGRADRFPLDRQTLDWLVAYAIASSPHQPRSGRPRDTGGNR